MAPAQQFQYQFVNWQLQEPTALGLMLMQSSQLQTQVSHVQVQQPVHSPVHWLGKLIEIHDHQVLCFICFSFTNKSSPAFELKTKSPYGLILKSHVLRLVWRLLKKYCRLTIIPVAGKFDGFSDQFRTWHNPHGCCNSWTRNICGEVGDHQSHQIESKSCRLGAFGIVVCKTQCLRHQSRTRPQCCSIQCHKCSFQRYNYQLGDNPDLEN